MARPSVDVVVPFRGPPGELRALRARLERVTLKPGDSVVVVDNTRRQGLITPEPDGHVEIVQAADIATPGFARNRGVARGSAEWLVFIDADTVPIDDLLDRYFDPVPREATALLAGGVRDEAVPIRSKAVARYAHISAGMSQDNTLQLGRWGFAQTANAACRRLAFEAVRDFREDIRAAEDADLTYRLRAAGWDLERREGAAVVHRSRQSVSGFVVQKAGHGAGAAWLNRTHPGSHPARRRPGLAWWAVRRCAKGMLLAARPRDHDEALHALFDPLEQLTYEFGRSLPNERPVPAGSPWSRLLSRSEGS